MKKEDGDGHWYFQNCKILPWKTQADPLELSAVLWTVMNSFVDSFMDSIVDSNGQFCGQYCGQ